MTISFKSVGKTQATKNLETPDATTLPVGLKTPLRLGNSGEGLFAMHFDLADQAKDNLRNLLLTNWGERLGVYDFGANLKELTTELTAHENFDNEVMVRIKNAVSRWMPYVILNDFESNINNERNENIATIVIKVTYDIPILSVKNAIVEITLYAIG